MKKTIAAIILLTITLGAFAQGKYAMKSGIAETKTIAGGHETYATQYFDDYGNKESLKQRMEIPGMVSYDYYTVTEGEKAWMITIVDGKKSVKAFDNPTPDLTFINPGEAVQAKYKMQYLGEETVLGRNCEIYSYEVKQNRKTVLWTVSVYKGFPLKTIIKSGKKVNTVVVTELRENETVPQEVFFTGE